MWKKNNWKREASESEEKRSRDVEEENEINFLLFMLFASSYWWKLDWFPLAFIHNEIFKSS